MGNSENAFFLEWEALCDCAGTDKAFDFLVVNGCEGQSDAILRLEHTLYLAHIKENYESICKIFLSDLPKQDSQWKICTFRRLVYKRKDFIKNQTDSSKELDAEQQSGGSRIVATFYDYLDFVIK